jgi:hypothetical protein
MPVVLRFICAANRYNRVGEDHYDPHRWQYTRCRARAVYAAESGGLEGREQVEDTRTGGRLPDPPEQDRRRALQDPRVEDLSPASTGS